MAEGAVRLGGGRSSRFQDSTAQDFLRVDGAAIGEGHVIQPRDGGNRLVRQRRRFSKIGIDILASVQPGLGG